MAKLRGTLIIILIGVILYLLTFFLEPVYVRLWLQFVTAYVPLLTLNIFGYIILGLSVMFLALFLITKKKKHPLRRNTFFIAFVFLLIMALPHVLPIWYNSLWAF